MDSLKEIALKAILNDEFTDEELTALLNHVFPEVNEAYLAECAKRKALGDAMKTIAHMDVVDGRVNDTAYSQVMEELEDMRNAWLSEYEDQDDEEGANPISETIWEESSRKPKKYAYLITSFQPKKVRPLPPLYSPRLTSS